MAQNLLDVIAKLDTSDQATMLANCWQQVRAAFTDDDNLSTFASALALFPAGRAVLADRVDRRVRDAAMPMLAAIENAVLMAHVPPEYSIRVAWQAASGSAPGAWVATLVAPTRIPEGKSGPREKAAPAPASTSTRSASSNWAPRGMLRDILYAAADQPGLSAAGMAAVMGGLSWGHGKPSWNARELASSSHGLLDYSAATGHVLTPDGRAWVADNPGAPTGPTGPTS